MNDYPRYVTVRDYMQVVREHRWLIVLVTLVFTGASVAFSLSAKKSYQAEASLQFQEDSVNPGFLGALVPNDATPEQRAAIDAQRVRKPQVVQEAARILQVSPASANGLLSHISSRPEAKTNLVIIDATSSNPRAAANLANAFAQATQKVRQAEVRDGYAQAARAIRRQIAALGNGLATFSNRTVLQVQAVQLDQGAKVISPVQIARAATVPRSPASPKPVLGAVLGVLIGLIVGVLAAFVRDAMDRRFKSSEEITTEFRLPIVGYVREDALGKTATAMNGRRPLTEVDLEGFRILRTNVEFLNVDKPPGVVLVTSSLPEEGKSTVAAALAGAYAAAGKRTLLVECDLRQPTLAKRLGLAAQPGLTDVLTGQATPADVAQTVLEGFPNSAASPLQCVVAGTETPLPAELLRSERAKAFLAEACEAYDAVVIDSSPILPVVDTLELLSAVDGLVVCVRASRTTREQARAAKTTLEHFPKLPTGVVVTGLRSHRDAYAYPAYSATGRVKRG
jgi:capsular exopolysaccharide synthesis family protein